MSDVDLSISGFSHYDFWKCSAELVKPDQTLIHKEKSTDHVSLAGRAGSAWVRSADQLAVISMLFLSFFFRLFLSSVLFQIALHKSELKTLMVFPAVEKELQFWSKISGLLLYRMDEPGIRTQSLMSKNFLSLASPAASGLGLRTNKINTPKT